MDFKSVVVFGILLCSSRARVYEFPEWFNFGVASAAYQVEGGRNDSDRGENIWDRMIQTRPEVIADRSNADVACDSYHLWRRDIEILEEIGVNMYRFSLSWSRLLPTGFSNYISEDGKRYYNNLIDGLIEKGIQPVVTMYHCDLPQSLQDLGGWANPLITDWFTDYANVIFSLYADRVKIWLTLNEPFGICDFSYGEMAAPYFNDMKVGRYICNKNVLIAHAKVYRLYDEMYKPTYHGKVSLTNLFFWFEPKTPDDVEATELAIEYWEGRYSHAIFSKEGGWPKKLEKILLENGKNEGYSQPRLPPFTPAEIELVKGTYDFYGLNHYTTRLVSKIKPGDKLDERPLTIFDEINVKLESHPNWKPTVAYWYSIYPQGLRHQLNWLKNKYNPKEIIITENGFLSLDPSVIDTDRLEYYRDYLEQVLLAMEDGVPVTGYIAWTMMDNFEWLSGYSILCYQSWGMVQFPEWFQFGAASSSYQVEGGWNASDKGESMWDRLLHSKPEVAAEQANGDVACDSYHLWRRDIEMAEELGLDIYRFSISWPRLLPNGFANYISDDGKRYYNNLINGLLAKGIQPVVTLYHFDLPQILQDLGGWTNPLIADWFSDYARIAFILFGDRVKIWLTINEPFGICDVGYSMQQAPYVNDTKIGKYLCNKFVLIAHAKAWRIYDEEFRPQYKGKVSLATLFIWYEPATPEDETITDLTIEYWEGRYAYPIFSKKGGWPPAIEKYLADKAKQEGYAHPRLLPFTSEEIELIRGTYDFYGLNHYTTRLVRKARPGEVIGSWPFYGSDEMGIQLENDRTWKTAAADWFAIYPEGLRKQLHWLNKTYGVKEILITENGYLAVTQDLDDWERLQYIRDNLKEIQLAIEDGLNITGYIVWTMMDNFEWLAGYKVNFGHYAVNFTDPLRPRTPRESARYYSAITRRRSIYHTDYETNYVT